MTAWYKGLRKASFGGVAFGVLGGQLRVGRRNAVHTYPFKDEVWVEDMGRDARRITITGFLLENASYGGGDVIGQRERMVAACESAGPSTLVHPTLGTLQVSLLESTFNERWDQGRVFEITFSFIEGGLRQFPRADASTADSVGQACTAADAAAGIDFSTAAGISLPAGSSVVGMAVSTAGAWTSTALMLTRDATNLMNTVASLPGNFSRFLGAGLRGITGFGGLAGATATVESLIAIGTAARGAVVSACAALSTAASILGVGNSGSFATSAQGVSASLLAATTDPADSLRVLSSLAAFTPNAPTPLSAVGTAMATMQGACGDLFRRAAVVSACRASANYQPSSFDDAVAVRAQVTGLLDAEIQIAGDQGADATYSALRAVRAAVVQDLTTRGANLATLVTIKTPRPMPSLVLAQRVYRDVGRSDELVAEAGCIHPAFMPTSFKGLSV